MLCLCLVAKIFVLREACQRGVYVCVCVGGGGGGGDRGGWEVRGDEVH